MSFFHSEKSVERHKMKKLQLVKVKTLQHKTGRGEKPTGFPAASVGLFLTEAMFESRSVPVGLNH